MKLLYHHKTNLQALSSCIVGQKGDLWHGAYQWWEENYGYTPVFVAVGDGPQTFELTGYPNQFAKIISTKFQNGKRINTLRKLGEAPNHILLSFDYLEGHCHRFWHWEELLAWAFNWGNHKIPKYVTQRLIKAGCRSQQSWERAAKRKDGYIQMCLPSINPKLAKRVFVRNLATKRKVEQLGYNNVQVRHMPAPRLF